MIFRQETGGGENHAIEIRTYKKEIPEVGDEEGNKSFRRCKHDTWHRDSSSQQGDRPVLIPFVRHIDLPGAERGRTLKLLQFKLLLVSWRFSNHMQRMPPPWEIGSIRDNGQNILCAR
jgi:hypothetical protein